MYYKLTSHLGDSGIKKSPSTKRAQGIMPAQLKMSIYACYLKNDKGSP
jgi:hypothetical protein